ncbi:exodeoxyribonuclease V subunit beta [Dickeya dadantii]|uniref:exodeoxyribonuclease V subunit beta n=1 Tax=Dickeya dadantii TaxID=204038 RepID=UPI0020A6B290|nr:exodeoxyribonuclease V subunit beta [Dickeya dadantii]
MNKSTREAETKMILTVDEERNLRERFERECAELPDFDSPERCNYVKADFTRNAQGVYIDKNVEAVWGGFRHAEELKLYKSQPQEMPICPEPLEGECDCIRCKAMRFHKEKNIYVCLTCHKKTEPFRRISYIGDWLSDMVEGE